VTAAAAVLARRRATAIGCVAIALWAGLALLTVATAPMPPFQLAALCFLVGGLAGLADARLRGVRLGAALVQPWRVWALGVGGLFGYHFAYFTALRAAPAAEASLIAYLWPLLIVLFSGLLPGESLRLRHVLGAAAGFGGAALLLAPGAGTGGGALLGYLAAGACALIWSGYSVLSRVVGNAPSHAVAGFCLASAALAALCHLALERTAWPADAAGWLAVLALGLGPVGGAFHAWDVGCKRGDIQLLGVAAYAAPVLSTMLLIAAGITEATPGLFVSAALITGGALVASGAGRGRRA